MLCRCLSCGDKPCDAVKASQLHTWSTACWRVQACARACVSCRKPLQNWEMHLERPHAPPNEEPRLLQKERRMSDSTENEECLGAQNP